MWFPTNNRELCQMYWRMFVWKYGRTCKVLFHIGAAIFLFWLLTFSW